VKINNDKISDIIVWIRLNSVYIESPWAWCVM